MNKTRLFSYNPPRLLIVLCILSDKLLIVILFSNAALLAMILYHGHLCIILGSLKYNTLDLTITLIVIMFTTI